jgi:hypothetical protein
MSSITASRRDFPQVLFNFGRFHSPPPCGNSLRLVLSDKKCRLYHNSITEIYIYLISCII